MRSWIFGNRKDTCRTAKQTSKRVAQQFEQKKAKFDLIVFILNKMFSFVFLKVILAALRYHQNYTGKIDFENFYITEYFRHVDQRRKKEGKLGLLPLRKIEASNMVNLKSKACKQMEIRKILVYLILLLLQTISATIFILMDHLFYETLHIVAERSRVDFTQEGFHDVNVTVSGDGLIARMVRRSVEGMNMEVKLNLITNNEECLPRPSKLEVWSFVQIYSLLLGIAILILNEAYVNRLRRLICAWFYPKRERQRVLFLYNRMLKRRKTLRQMLIQRMQEQIRRHRYGSTLDFLDRVIFFYPSCCGWLKFVRKKACSICDSRGANHYNDCSSYDCFLTYCDDCWIDLGQTCLACQELGQREHDCGLFD
ncbi:protein sneaky [Uranotaenia lowii]|uniref:protein sneaky n=1 Tax=Uranotaenia lowii TaxID=190385 RepID=UPI002478D168|nr:protein sneaky [Uranotaenia lowii]